MQKYQYKPVKSMQIDDVIEGFYILKAPAAKTTQNGKDYLSFKLSDASGDMEGIFWDYAGDLHVTSSGRPVKVRGTVSEYNGKRQFTAAQIRAAREDDPIDASTLVPAAPIDPKQAYDQVVNILDSIQDPEYKAVSLEMLARNKEMFCSIPAAKAIHHAFRYGLLMHTYFLLCHADYMSRFYPFVNRDLLLAGTLCHDLAKVLEYDLSPLCMVNDYSVEGQLLGHLYLGAREISKIADALGVSEEKSMLLQHMILSHHGKAEFGAAVVPKTAESLLLSLIDDLDAKMEVYRETLDGSELGMTASSVWALGTRIYNHE